MGSTILLADKSITIQKIVELTFADDNYVIRSFSDGAAALEALPQVRPDLILADISLPVKNGYDLCKSLRNDPALASFSHIPVILLAGIYETMDEERTKQVEERVKEVEADTYLSKPFDPQVLVSKVHEYMNASRVPHTSMQKERQPQTVVEKGSSVTPSIASVAPISFAHSAETEPYDDEKTMVLPGPLVSPNFLNESATEQSTEQAQDELNPRSYVDVNTITPLYEPVFEPDAMNNDGDSVPAEEPTVLLDRYEIEASVEEEDLIGQEPGSEDDTPLIMATADEPFADVIAPQPAQRKWTNASEEDEPFGVSEPALQSEFVNEGIVQEEQLDVASADIAEADSETLMMNQSATVSLMQPEEPAEPEGRLNVDDTWPGIHLEAGTQHVEELFESAAEPVEVSSEMPSPDEISGSEELSVEEAQAEEEGSVIEEEQVVSVNDEFINHIVEKVLAKMSERIVSEIVWQVVPDLAEKMIRRELEKLHEAEE